MERTNHYHSVQFRAFKTTYSIIFLMLQNQEVPYTGNFWIYTVKYRLFTLTVSWAWIFEYIHNLYIWPIHLSLNTRWGLIELIGLRPPEKNMNPYPKWFLWGHSTPSDFCRFLISPLELVVDLTLSLVLRVHRLYTDSYKNKFVPKLSKAILKCNLLFVS